MLGVSALRIAGNGNPPSSVSSGATIASPNPDTSALEPTPTRMNGAAAKGHAYRAGSLSKTIPA